MVEKLLGKDSALDHTAGARPWNDTAWDEAGWADTVQSWARFSGKIATDMTLRVNVLENGFADSGFEGGS
jgi:hypothetical protein